MKSTSSPQSRQNSNDEPPVFCIWQHESQLIASHKSWQSCSRLFGLQNTSPRPRAHREIIPSMQARFTETLMRDMANVPFQADRIFSQAESGRPKTEVLRMLEERHPNTEYHFIEDKFGTLEKVLTHESSIHAKHTQIAMISGSCGCRSHERAVSSLINEASLELGQSHIHWGQHLSLCMGLN